MALIALIVFLLRQSLVINLFLGLSLGGTFYKNYYNPVLIPVYL